MGSTVTPRTLAEILAEGERLEARVTEVTAERDHARAVLGYAWTHDMIDAWNARALYYQKHGPRLLAAVGAAMEMRDDLAKYGGPSLRAIAAFDAAANGGRDE